jgi:hypothetical protein
VKDDASSKTASTTTSAPQPDPATASLVRRLRIAGNTYRAVSGIASKPVVRNVCHYGRFSLESIPNQIAKSGFDIIESVRLRRIVPCFGHPENAAYTCAGPLAQHPRYRTYWYDRSKHAMVGMHVGLDVIRNDNRYHIVENNIRANVSQQRRNLYGDIDPLHENLVAFARSNGFSRLAIVGGMMAPHNIDGLKQAGHRHGISVRLMHAATAAPGMLCDVTAMPEEMESDTLYFFHAGRKTAMVHYVHDKQHSAEWLSDALPATGAKLTVSVPMHYDLMLPQVDPGPQWPNLVVKLSGSDRGEAILMCRFDSVEEAARVLDVRNTGDIPLPLRRGLMRRLRRFIHGNNQPIYQPYMPPSTDQEGHTQAIRLHAFVSPLANTYLSSHLRVSEHSIPKRVQHGVIEDAGPFIASASSGWARYGSIDELDAPESELETVAAEFGAALHHAMAAKFDIGDA